jgi:hypothetical protein
MPNYKRYYLENGVTIIFDYYNNDGKSGGKFSVNLSDCVDSSNNIQSNVKN